MREALTLLAAAGAAQALHTRHGYNGSIPASTALRGSSQAVSASTTHGGTGVVRTTASTTLQSTAVANASVINYSFNVQDLWDLRVGPVATAATTTTVSPTPIPASSLVPPPPLYYSPFPTGAQWPRPAKNESWSFPKDFWWGVAGAAFQIEGAANADGRGPSIWDKLTRVPNYIYDNTTADIVDNHYYLYKQDIARIAAMGVTTYSFTLSWSRIMPFGSGQVNQVAIDHYNDVINTCLEYNLIPMVTLYHWDLPLVLQDTYGGWLDERIVDDFASYSTIAYAAFGDRVKYFFSLNEPAVYCNTYPLPAGYFKNVSIPKAQQPFHCGQSVLLAHAKSYHIGKAMWPNATITYKNNGGYKIPLTNSSDDALAVQRAWDFAEGWFSDPIYLTGDYNAAVKAYVSTFLRPFTDSEKQSILGSSDLYAHDAYTSQFYFAPDTGVAACVANISHPLYPACANTSYTYSAEDGGWLIGPAADPLSPWLHKATDWTAAFLHYLADTWAKDLPIAVTEFGFAEPFEGSKTLLQDILYDPVRMSYMHDYLRGILSAMSEGVNVVGCLAWSFVDNFEWATGVAAKFGMQYVNFTDPARPRYYKASFFEFTSAFEIYQEK